MKNIVKLCIVVSFVIVSLCGCNKTIKTNEVISNNSSETIPADNTEEIQNTNKLALTITSQSDFIKLAFSLSELYKDSDIVCEIKVKEVNPYIDGNGRIYTEVIPEVVNIFKGTYNNESFHILGGRMNYSEYMSNEVVKRKFEGKTDNNSIDEELLNKDVIYIADNGYVYSVGDQYIFFGMTNPNGSGYIQSYGYQGSYKIESNKISNKALKDEDPLNKDINSQFFTNQQNQISSGVDKDIFVKIIKGFKDNNTEN